MEATATVASSLDFEDPSLYLNRELSLLAFQRRVLEEAQDSENRLLERPKFLSILFSNLDELFMVRVARLQQQLEQGAAQGATDGLSISATLHAIREEVLKLVSDAYGLLNKELMPALSDAGIHIVRYSELDKRQRQFADEYFKSTVFPILTPLAFDPGRPFPHISNLSLSIAVVVKEPQGREHFGRVKVPNTLSQLVRIPGAEGDNAVYFVWVDDLITGHMQMLFPGMEILGTYPFHVTRDAEVLFQEKDASDLLDTIQEAVWSRRFRDVVRLQIHADMPPKILEILTTNLGVTETEIYKVDGPIDLGRLKHLSVDRPDLKDIAFIPAIPNGFQGTAKEDIFARIKRGSLLLHHPYESFQPVVDFLRKAARDPDVMAIKATLYRVGKKSPIVEALLEAVENGKQVAVLVELKARFDEQSNIEWANALEAEGVHVVYGLPGLKVHSKVLLVVRREGEKMTRYMHLGTGNYNALTARLYTDLGYFTCDDAVGADVSDLFNHLTGYSIENRFRKLLVAPISLRNRVTELIEREIAHQRKRGDGRLIFKMNALEDPTMIALLYRASEAGVQIDLVVRGICCLRPGLKGISENIRVVSIVGRFLEHSRVYYFHNGGKEEVYLGSADLMPRNLDRRIEILFPVEKQQVQALKEFLLGTYLKDRDRTRCMQADGTYVRLKGQGNSADSDRFDAQSSFLEHYSAKS